MEELALIKICQGSFILIQEEKELDGIKYEK